uniref:Uncharacterized protein n=1 Tax=Oryza glumipatula TaxID=40148 RepID=A0A0D9ZU14_9ORYZ
MSWWQSQKSIRKGGGGTAAPATAAAAGGIGGGGEVAVQKVYHNLAPKPTFRKIDSIKEDINKKADRFIKMTRARLFNQTRSFRQPAGSPPATAAGRDGKLF